MLDVRALAPHDLMPKLLAAASVPVLADPMLNGASGLFDGAFVTPLPVREVLSDGYTDLVVILTLPRWSGPPFWEELVLGALARRRGVRRELVRAAGGGRRARRESLRVLRKPPPGVNVTVIAPEVRLTKSLDQRPEWIERSVEAGVQAGRLAVELARCART
jgi:predicted patatin/cPLA2 family phospholipase